MPAGLEGRRVLVTGAARRVGAAIAEALAARGARVAVHCRRSKREAAALAERLGGAVVTADLSDSQALGRLAKDAVDALGGLDALVNNASAYARTPFGRVTARHWDEQLAVNARAPFLLAQALAPALARARPGHVVNVADWSAVRPYADYAPYCASKAALVAATLSLAKALAPRVLVNAVLPGPVLGPAGASRAGVRRWERAAGRANLLGRVGTPEDVAAAVVYLLESRFVTGTLLPVDGGRLIA